MTIMTSHSLLRPGRFGLRELAHITSYMETNNSSEEQPTLSSNQERLSSERKEEDYCDQRICLGALTSLMIRATLNWLNPIKASIRNYIQVTGVPDVFARLTGSLLCNMRPTFAIPLHGEWTHSRTVIVQICQSGRSSSRHQGVILVNGKIERQG
jgi:hypothetical protein